MKNLLNSVIATAMVSLAFVSFESCQKEEGFVTKQPSATLSVKVVNPSTKTTYTDNGTSIDVNWALEDELILYKNDSNTGAESVVFELESGAGEAEGVFKIANAAQQPVTGQAVTENQYNWESEYIAYYPSTAQKRDLTAEEFLGQFPQQIQNGNDKMDHLEKYDLMKATKAAKDDELGFSHQVAVLKMIVQVPTKTGDAYTESTDYSRYFVDNMTVRGLWGSRAYQVSFAGDAQAKDYVRGDKTYKVVIGYITVPAADAAAGAKLDVDMMMHFGQISPTFKNSHVYSEAVSYQAGKMYVCEVGMTDPYSVTEYVDLGLPSGTLWAKTNLGADEDNPEGHYFQWGEVNGFKYGKNIRMVFNPETKEYDEQEETIGNSSCILNDANYQALYDNAGFRSSTFTIDNTVNAWYTSSETYTAPDYQGIVAQWPITTTTTETVVTFTPYTGYTPWLVNEAYGTNDSEINDANKFRVYYNNYRWRTSDKRNGTPYEGTVYTRKEESVAHETTTYHTVGDAATYQLGEAWHMPAAWQIAELLQYTTRKEVNGKLIFTSTVEGYTDVTMDISNSSGWERGWTQAKTGECRFQTTTAAHGSDNASFGSSYYAGNYLNETYCWEFHYVTSNNDPYKIGIHSHHTRSTAVPIRPVAVVQARRN